MAEVDLSPKARADLVEIRIYSIEKFGADTADAYFLGFDQVFDLLADHPLAGQERPELGIGIRCFVHRRHRIFYRIEDEMVVIIRIVHHKMNARRTLTQ